MKLIDDTKKKRKNYSINRFSKTGRIVHSNPEEEIADYLDRNGIPYQRPTTAFKGQYYKNFKFIPDFIIDNVVIEYFGIKGNKKYDDTIKLKQQHKYPNKEYKFLFNINEIGSLCTRFKHLIGKNPQISLDSSFKDIIKEDEEFKSLLKYYNNEIKNKMMSLFNQECGNELKNARYTIFERFMQNKGKKHLHSLLLLEKEKN